ncbi:MAG TPA: hypothetical protein VKC35_07680 [Vicinamibacterales bacterium]|nr:hypothetical protein [Vicinamibacterales bacterium]
MRIGLTAFSALVVAAVVWATAMTGEGQAPPAGRQGQPQAAAPRPAAAPAARTEDGRPNFNGIWEALGSSNFNIEAHNAEPGPRPEILGAWGAEPGGIGIVEGGTIPYKPEALRKKQDNFKNRTLVKVTNDPHRFDTADPEIQCYRPGVPRANYMPFPFQIFQNRDQIMIVYEYKGAMRTVFMDKHQEAPVDSWMGWSNGRWEGDTLVIDVTGFNGHQWLDRAGNFFNDTAHVVERWTPKGRDHMMYEATIEDPTVYTRPWKISFPIYRRQEANAQLLEFNCVPFVEEMMYTPLGLYNPPNRSSR